MVTVKLFGLVSLDSGILSMQVEARSVREVIEKVASTGKADKIALRKSTIFVDGKRAMPGTKIRDGREVVFFSPAGGG